MPNQSRQNIWLTLGIAFIVLGVGIVISAFWFVQKRRAELKPAQPSTPLVTAGTTMDTVEIASFVNLITMRREELVKLLPSYALVRLKSESGEGQPDDLRVIIEGEEQYVVMLGSRLSGNNKKERLLAVFKLEVDQLVDMTSQAIPSIFPGGRIGNEPSRIQFADNRRDLEIAASVWPGDKLIEECPVCGHAYSTQELVWQNKGYKLGKKGWHNDPYTVCYVTAQALDKRLIEERDRPFLADSLDSEISAGFERQPDRLWTMEKLTPNKEAETEESGSLSFLLDNSVETITITVSKQDGRWQATALKRESQK